MRNSFLPVMTVLTVIAVAVGLQLGATTIAQIDPLYFEGKAPAAQDVTKGPQPVRQNAYAQASGWAEGYQARARDCGDCPLAVGQPAASNIPDEPLYSYSDPTIEPRWQTADAPLVAEPLPPARSAEANRVSRYLDYPVSADQAEARAARDNTDSTPARPNGTPGL